jgi:hypothetical protein
MRQILGRAGAALVIVALLVPWQSLDAQVERQGRWDIVPRIGYVMWDDAGGLQDPVFNGGACDYPDFNQTCASAANSLMAGLSALYWFVDAFAIGVAFDVARPVTNGAYFLPAEMTISGASQLTLVSQRLTVLQYQVEGEFAPNWKLAPVVMGGIGGYTVYGDPPKSDAAAVTGFKSQSDLMFSIGVGLDWALGAAGGLRLSVTDMVYTGWDREGLNVVDPAYQSAVWPDLIPAPPEASETLHNFNIALAFTFVPGGRR